MSCEKQLTNKIPHFTVNDATEWGQRYEDYASRYYSAITGLELVDQPIGFMVHEYEKKGDTGRKRYGATPDFLTKSGIVVEIKCPFRRKITHAVPTYYLAQVQMQLEVCQAETAHFVQYLPPSAAGPGLMDIYCIQRDPTWWKCAVPIFDEFWDDVIGWYRKRGRELGDKSGYVFNAQELTEKDKRLLLTNEGFGIVQK